MTHSPHTPAVQQVASVTDALAWLRGQGVRRLQTDSRQVQPGDAFIAWPGLATDGRRFVPSALAAGAVACLVEAEGLDGAPDLLALAPEQVPAVASLRGLKALTGELAAAFFDHPSHRVQVVAITGTNGKTSTAWWLAQALAAAGRPCGLVGTLGMGLPGPADDPLSLLRPTGLTTPDPVAVQWQLHQWVQQGMGVCALEASSIGLVEHRLAGTAIAVAAFTNFTQDHLDHHGSMAAYWAAKRSLFDWPGLQAAVVNVDDPQGQRLAAELAQTLTLWTVSLAPATGPAPARHLSAQSLGVSAHGMCVVVGEGGQTVALDVPLVGRYNAANLLGVVACLRALGLSLPDAAAACAHLGAVPGRMEQVNRWLPAVAGRPEVPGDSARRARHSVGSAGSAPTLPLVLVDYAHTPDAVAQALQALQPLAAVRGGQLHCVVGCGGDRDASKRPLMAAAAEALAQHLCLTSDNPRSEDPLAILADMRRGLLRPDAVRTVPDRALAIASQVAQAQPADVVLIAGKGHETTQEVAGHQRPFSDQAHALRALQARLSGTPFNPDPCAQAHPA